MRRTDKLGKIIADARQLLDKPATVSSPEFKAWRTNTERFLVKTYGEDSIEVRDFLKTSFSLFSIYASVDDEKAIFRNGLQTTIKTFSEYLEELMDEAESNSSTPSSETVYKERQSNNKIFIVHGHNEGIKQAIARLLEKQGLVPVILHEQPNQGATIIEKFEKSSDVSAAICLFTSDDVGKAKSEHQANSRARQNVVFEAGFFMGSLGRNRVIIISERSVELPSDLEGVVYTDSSSWQFDVLRELKAMDFQVDYNKIN